MNSVSNPISDKYIQEKKADKKAGQVVNSLVRNAKMTPTEARQAVANVNEPKLTRVRTQHNYKALASKGKE